MNYSVQKIENKKELQRIDWRIVRRLVTSLYYNSRMKKTHIATKCNLGYDKCRLYLDWMEMMDLIKRETDFSRPDKGERIKLMRRNWK